MLRVVALALVLATACQGIEYELGCEAGVELGTGQKCQALEDAQDYMDDLDLELGGTQPYSEGVYDCYWAAYDAWDDSDVCD